MRQDIKTRSAAPRNALDFGFSAEKRKRSVCRTNMKAPMMVCDGGMLVLGGEELSKRRDFMGYFASCVF